MLADMFENPKVEKRSIIIIQYENTAMLIHAWNGKDVGRNIEVAEKYILDL